MATLRYSQIRITPGGTIRYIADEEKNISSTVHDVCTVLRYMGEPESTERVYAIARYCSTNPALAEKQMELYRQLYYDRKERKPKEEELLGLHFFISYTEEDDPSEEVMNLILRKLLEHPLFRDFPAFAAHHFDKAHRHSHFYVCQFSAAGKTRKMCLRFEDFNEIRRYANRLCVEHGLSIIDLGALRHNNPDYSAWIDQVIAEGKIIVHPETPEHKLFPRQTLSTRDLYYKRRVELEEKIQAEAKLLTDHQRKQQDFESKYFYTPDGNRHKRWYKSGDPKHGFYAVPIYEPSGYRRSPLELTVRFVLVILKNESQYMQSMDSYTWLKYNAKTNWPLQKIYNAIETARRMHIESYREIPAKLTDIGAQMNALKQEKSRHEKSIETHRKLIEAFQTYTRIRPLVEGVADPQEAHCDQYVEAYSILARNQLFTAETYQRLQARYQFKKQKITDYEKRLPELRRQYRDLKLLQAFASRPMDTIQEVYAYSKMAEEKAAQKQSEAASEIGPVFDDGSLQQVLEDAKARARNSVKGKPKTDDFTR